MASSGTYTWFPKVAEVITEAFERAGVDPSSVGTRHLESARLSLNYLFSDWQNDGLFLWKVTENTKTLTQGDTSFVLAAGEIDIIDAYHRRSGLDIPIVAISRMEYINIPDKDQQGRPDRYWVDRSKIPTAYIWPASENSTDVIHYWALVQFEDVATIAEDADAPRRWQEAIVSGLSAKLALKYNIDRFPILEGLARAAFDKAAMEERERGDIVLTIGRGFR